MIGPKRLTRFEKARITGARSLQISFGAPLMIKGDVNARSSISLAIEELEKKHCLYLLEEHYLMESTRIYQ